MFIIKKENIIEIDEEELTHPKEVVTSANKIQEQFQKEKEEIEKIEAPEEKQKATIVLEAKKTILENFTKPQASVARIGDLKKEEIKQQAIAKIKENKDFNLTIAPSFKSLSGYISSYSCQVCFTPGNKNSANSLFVIIINPFIK